MAIFQTVYLRRKGQRPRDCVEIPHAIIPAPPLTYPEMQQFEQCDDRLLSDSCESEKWEIFVQGRTIVSYSSSQGSRTIFLFKVGLPILSFRRILISSITFPMF
jgi:hypothetical protein